MGATNLQLSPQAALDGLLDSIEDSLAVDTRYRYEASNITFLPDQGWILVLFVARDERFAPARYLIVQRRGALLSADLMIPPAARQTESTMTTLTGPELEQYLAHTRLDLSRLHRIYASHYADRAPRIPPPR